jgi:hypothetical protein
MYFDLTFCFFFIKIPLFEVNNDTDPSKRLSGKAHRTNIARQISPFLLNLNLNPLYSNLGGSTILADPLIKKPTVVQRLWNPLYRWNVLSHLTLVLSETCIQDCFNIIIFGGFFFYSNPSSRRRWLLF